MTIEQEKLKTAMTSPSPLGQHIIADFQGAKHLTDGPAIFAAMRRAAELSGAQIVGEEHHLFGPNDGVTGVVLLAESHISIHTWPENAFAAIDIFMCGPNVNSSIALDHLAAFFEPTETKITTIERG